MAQAPPHAQPGCQAGEDEGTEGSPEKQHASGAALALQPASAPALDEPIPAAGGTCPSAALRLKHWLALRWHQLSFRAQNAILAFVIGGLMYFNTLLIMAGSLLAPAFLVGAAACTADTKRTCKKRWLHHALQAGHAATAGWSAHQKPAQKTETCPQPCLLTCPGDAHDDDLPSVRGPVQPLAVQAQAAALPGTHCCPDHRRLRHGERALVAAWALKRESSLNASALPTASKPKVHVCTGKHMAAAAGWLGKVL
jgi:hypothetical protein